MKVGAKRPAEARARRGRSTGSRRGSGSDAVYQALRSAIIEQTLKPGTKLPEGAIAKRFTVSRTLVRQALGRLAGDRLVVHVPNRGASVARPTVEEARSIFEVRRGLERMVAEALSGRLSTAQQAVLEAHVSREEAELGRDGPRSVRLAGDFHILLARMTGNELLQTYVEQVSSRCSLIIAGSGRPHSSDCAVSEHRRIIAALAAGDRSRAVALMDRHLRAVMERALVAPSHDADIGELLSPYVAG